MTKEGNPYLIKQLIELITSKTGKSLSELAKDWDIGHRQQINSMKNSKAKDLQRLVKWKQDYKLTWGQIGKALEGK